MLNGVDDLADSYVSAVKRAGGQKFNIINNQSESMSDMLDTVAEITEYKGKRFSIISNNKDFLFLFLFSI